MTLKKVLDIPETKVEHDTTLNGDGSTATPLSIDAKVSSPITGNGDVATPLDIDENALAGSMAGSGIRNNNGDFEADLVVNAPLTGKGRTGLPLDVNSATASAEGVVSLTDSTELPTDINSDTTALTPKALEKRLKYLKPVASSSAMNAEQLSASAIKIPFLQNFTCDGGTNGKPKFDVPKEDGTFCNIDLGALGGSGSGSFPETVWTGSSTSCVTISSPGLYYAEVSANGGIWAIPFSNVGDIPSDSAPHNNAGWPNSYPRCLTLVQYPTQTDGTDNPSIVSGGIACGKVKGSSTGTNPITKIVRVH